MTVVKRRNAVLILGIAAVVLTLSGCHVENPPDTSAYSAPVGTPTPYVLPTPGATATATASPTATPTKSATKAAPKPTASPEAKKATPAPKVTTAAPKASTAAPKPAPKASTVAPKPAPTKHYPSITLGKLAWSGHGCLYRWSGSGWQSKNLCRTPRVEPRDYNYTDGTGRVLFTAVFDPALALIHWSDTKLVYQQYTNVSLHTYLNGTFGPYLLQQASFDNGDSFAIDDFFNQTARLAAFGNAHPTADLHRSTRDSQWFIFYNFWRPAILAGNCATNYLCP